jgi:hypothetical protein
MEISRKLLFLTCDNVLRDQGYRTFQRAVMNERETMVE